MSMIDESYSLSETASNQFMRGKGMKSLLASVICLLFSLSVGAQTSLKPPKETVLDRFLRYVKIDTQSAEDH